ncbi:MAG: YraN family protein [Cytophagales bacterium]|nr:YraN family protein [Cytophagales bacterium]
MKSSSNNTTLIGAKGEAMAKDYLSAKGYDILQQNYRYRRAEIDIIAKYHDVLIFVEVKYRKSAEYGTPESFVSETKKEHLQSAANKYMEDAGWHSYIRFDIVAIVEQEILHLEDVF